MHIAEVSDERNWNNLEGTVKIGNRRISNLNDVERGSDCEMTWATKLDIQMKSDWLLICFTFVTKSPGKGQGGPQKGGG